MARPSKKRIVGFNPNVKYFKPRGIPMSELEEITLTVDECEALRLADSMGLSHEDAGQEMGVSRATFGRIIQKARKRLADALVKGQAIRIEGGMVKHVRKWARRECPGCKFQWKAATLAVCPECRYESVLDKEPAGPKAGEF